MHHIPFTLTAYLLNAIAVTVDKFLITKRIPDPLIYIFYFSLVSLLALFVIPFLNAPPLESIALSSVATLLWASGVYFMLKALKIGQVSRVVPVIGTIIPTVLLLEAFFTSSINFSQTLSISLLIAGLVFLTIHDWRGRLIFKELSFEIFSALFFAFSYLALHQAYQLANFINVFIYSRLILIPVGLIILLIPTTRRIIIPPKRHQPEEQSNEMPYWKSLVRSKTALFFALGQVSAVISELLLNFSIYLATPALVNSLQGIQYVFLFFISLILSKKNPAVFKEKITPGILVVKFLGIICIALGLYLLSKSS